MTATHDNSMDGHRQADTEIKSDGKWTAYCLVCEEHVQDPINNGGMAQAAAEKHVEETGHETILGRTFREVSDQ